MTVHKIVIIECNGCGTTLPDPGQTISDLFRSNGSAPAPNGVTDARHAAGLKGWRLTASGKDLCPACQSSKRAPVKSGGLLSHIPHPHFHRGDSWRGF